MKYRTLLLTTMSVAWLAAIATAKADAIDGNWCRADGKHMSIRGPSIVTPGGRETFGDYSRHAFSYVIPDGEAGAGNTVSIMLLSENLAHAREGENGALQEWKRCQPGIS